MNAACREFRERLSDALRGRASELSLLGWHEHLLGCAQCRSLLEAEEALEALLDSLPTPKLPPALAERVLLLLSANARLDRLLALDEPEAYAPGLPQRMLARLDQERRADALDRLLARVPEARAPANLARRTLAALERVRTTRAHSGRRSARRITYFVALAAAVLGLCFAGWSWIARSAGESTPPIDRAPLVAPEPPRASAQPSEDLLASLELLESLDLLEDEDLDLFLSGLSPDDELLLELVLELEQDAPAPVPEPPSKG